MKPIIGITVDAHPDADDQRTGGTLKLNWNYAEAIARAGGIPILIPPQASDPEVASLLDGLLIPGGNDIDAANWGEPNHPAVNPIEAERFDLERSLFAALPAETPVLGICYGCQFINVMRGGTLIQHLPDEVGHEGDLDGKMQQYRLDPTSRLSSLVGEQMEGQSWHHQGVGSVGAGLRVVGRNNEGTVEALEATDRPWMIGVQWHPERTMSDPATQKLFREFVAAASAVAAQRRKQSAAR